jgi:hypothetical protein
MKKGNIQTYILEEINKQVREGIPISLVLFNITIDDFVRKWQEEFDQNILKQQITSNTVLFTRSRGRSKKSGKAITSCTQITYNG